MSRNVRVAGSLYEEGEHIETQIALFTACCTAFLTFFGGYFRTNPDSFQSDWRKSCDGEHNSCSRFLGTPVLPPFASALVTCLVSTRMRLAAVWQ